MILYVYDLSWRVVARVHGAANAECERKADEANYGNDEYGWTYSPAFGFVDGLTDTGDAEDI